MEKIIAMFMSIFTIVLQLFGSASSDNYTQMTDLKGALNALKNKDSIIGTKYTGIPSDEYWSPEDEFDTSSVTTLYKEKDKDFVILNLADIHFSDYGARALYSLDAEMIMKRMVIENEPDLILLSGDNVCDDETSTVFSMMRITDIMESFGIPWAPVYGNHDDESNCDLNYLSDIMLKSPHCLLKKGDPEMGNGNYIINVAEKNDDGTDKIVETLIMMDSHHSQPNEKQQQWFKWATDGINALTNGQSEISVVMHIPLPEYQYAYDEAWNSTKRKWNDGYDAYGSLHEKICCERDGNGEPVQRGFFDIIKNSETTKYVFCGHEHMNNFSINYQGIRLTYCMKLGKGSGYQVGFNGGTVITVNNDGISRIQQKTVSFGPTITLADIDTTK